MNIIEEVNHPTDVFLNVLVSCRHSVEKFNRVLETILKDAEADLGKKCSKCGEWKPFAEFSAHHNTTDGHQYYCKLCAGDYARAYAPGYQQTEAGKATRKRSNEKYRAGESYRWRQKAREAVRAAVKAGDLPHISERVCEDCGEQAQIHHHDSYKEARWLDVRPLCGVHHKEWHSKWQAEEA